MTAARKAKPPAVTTAVAYGSVLVGLDPHVVTVTVTCRTNNGLGRLSIANLPGWSAEAAGRELRTRLRSALSTRIVLSLYVLDVQLEGVPTHCDTSTLDLPIAVAILRAAGERVTLESEAICIGTLKLDGRIGPVRGALCHATRDDGRTVVLPEANAWEAGLATARGSVLLLRDLAGLSSALPQAPQRVCQQKYPVFLTLSQSHCVDVLALGTRRALLVGPPGSGAYEIARGLAASATLSDDEWLKIASIHSAAGLLGESSGFTHTRPLRAPHHTVSKGGLLGGGDRPRPGEVSLAHLGVLVLDDVTEFHRSTLEALAATLTVGSANISRGEVEVIFPAAPYAVIACADPCPCGYAHVSRRGVACKCSAKVRKHYDERLAEICALLDLERVDLAADPDAHPPSTAVTG